MSTSVPACSYNALSGRGLVRPPGDATRPTGSSTSCTASALASLALLGIVVGSGCGRERSAAQPGREVVLKRGTTFAVRLHGDLPRGSARVGQPVEGTVLSALAGDDGSIPCTGWTAIGTVARIDPPARGESIETALLLFRELRSPEGQTIGIRAEATLVPQRAASRSLGIVAGGAVAGAILDRELDKSGRPPPGPGPELVARLVVELRLPRTGY